MLATVLHSKTSYLEPSCHPKNPQFVWIGCYPSSLEKVANPTQKKHLVGLLVSIHPEISHLQHPLCCEMKTDVQKCDSAASSPTVMREWICRVQYAAQHEAWQERGLCALAAFSATRVEKKRVFVWPSANQKIQLSHAPTPQASWFDCIRRLY